MKCTECGNETPSDSRYCEHCGAHIDVGGARSVDVVDEPGDAEANGSESDALGDGANADANPDAGDDFDSDDGPDLDADADAAAKASLSAGVHASWNADADAGPGTEEAPLRELADEPDGRWPGIFAPVVFDETRQDAAYAVEGIRRRTGEEPLVDPASGPDQPDLGKAQIALIAVVATLFAIALALVCCIVSMRILGI